MGDQSKIEWTDATWNPIRGCSMVSRGCEHCYAMHTAHRFAGPGQPYEGLTKLTEHGPVWTGEVRLVPELLDQPLRWKKPRRVFVNSMSDLFHEDVADSFLDQMFAVMVVAARRHVFQLLTKRPQRMHTYLCDPRVEERWFDAMPGVDAWQKRERQDLMMRQWPVPNIWCGVSVEDQKTADERIPLLLQVPAAVRWVSAEPLLSPVDLTGFSPFDAGDPRGPGTNISRLDWVIVGGESGPGARPLDVAWARSIVQQCHTASTAVFVKQLGANIRDRNDAGFEAETEHVLDEATAEWVVSDPKAWPTPLDVEHDLSDTNYQGAPVRVRLKDRKGGDETEWPEDLRVREYPR